MPSFSSIKTSFDVFLSEVKTCIDFLSAKGEVTNAIYSSLRNDAGIKHNKTIIEKKYIKVRLDSQVYLNSFFMIVCAAYEKFLTDTLKESLNQLKLCKDKSIIPEKLLKLNTKYSGSLLTTLDNKPSHLKLDYNEIVQNLASIHSETNDLVFNQEIVFYVKGILKFDSFIDFLEKFDIDIDIKTFANSQELKNFIGQSKESERISLIEKTHEEIFRIRNNIAHNGFSGDVTQNKILETVSFLEAFTNGVVTILQANLSKKYIDI